MLGECPIGYCIGEVFRVADCARNVDPQRRVMAANIVQQLRQIFLEMPALSQEQRDDRDVPDVLGGQSGNGRGKGRLHQFQKRQFYANAGLIPAESRRYSAKRVRPRRITGTMGKEKDCRSRRLAHAKSDRRSIQDSVADRAINQRAANKPGRREKTGSSPASLLQQNPALFSGGSPAAEHPQPSAPDRSMHVRVS